MEHVPPSDEGETDYDSDEYSLPSPIIVHKVANLSPTEYSLSPKSSDFIDLDESTGKLILVSFHILSYNPL